jgi:hypothetical protein
MRVPPLDLLLVARYALLAALCQLIPVPILDAMAESFIRRRLTRLQLETAGISPRPGDVAMLGDGSAGGCMGMVISLVMWPFRKALAYVLWVLLIKRMVDVFSDVVARAVLVHEAAEVRALPGNAVQVRAAMQRALRHTDVRPLERAVRIVFPSVRGEVGRLWRLGRAALRSAARRERGQEHQGNADVAPLDGGLEPLSQALSRAIWIPEVHDVLRTKLREEVKK